MNWNVQQSVMYKLHMESYMIIAAFHSLNLLFTLDMEAHVRVAFIISILTQKTIDE